MTTRHDASAAHRTDRQVPVIALVGSTATGKSAVSLELAELLNGEIINADSMQFYRGMDIGSAKLPVAERRGIPHHQLDTLEVSQNASVAQFQHDARADIADMHARGKNAIVVGGSGLYHRALIDHFEFPPTDPAVRRLLEDRAEVEGPGVLHQELRSLDPVAADRIDARNAKRIVRALEVIQLTGKEFSSSLPQFEYAIPTVQVGLDTDNEVLDARIDSRVGDMWEAGLVAEVEDLVRKGLRQATTARRGVGYAETLDYLDGILTAEETQDRIAMHTRRLARKQRKWFRPDHRVQWIDAPRDAADVSRAAREAAAIAGSLET
ncbi:tRNA (adenosine(37)-N6)-dimethylallyltransferase MiaA [Demequina sediminicola]|uniref:tRNA (adenosine(37)-N6)-dimethylallyltransferase MiaA n=1 Tax=Demequina sediminicola TaxID=1095026 RepID=UPI000B1C76A4|nr:tRNA (adenosine(37)-N6)-dimethylallyltransferase MiaA [Demequina sediminicola]